MKLQAIAFSCIAGVAVLTSPRNAAASSYEVIFNSGNAANGIAYVLAADSLGQLYGSATLSVFRLSPPAAGSARWTEKTLYTFTGSSVGSEPTGGVTIVGDALAGTAEGGVYGDGTAYKLEGPPPVVATVLHGFADKHVQPPDGSFPFSGLTLGLGDLLYGTTSDGGAGEDGTVFAVSASVLAPKYAIIHKFGSSGDGLHPGIGRLAVDSSGRLYGTTTSGGANGAGAVFMLQRVNGQWEEQVLYSFLNTNDLMAPDEGVVIDDQGDLYGCAPGGLFGKGGIYRLAPPTVQGESWNETVLVNFAGAPREPAATTTTQGCGLAIDLTTNQLFGTSFGGGQNNDGTIFEIDPPAVGQSSWTVSLIHSFTGSAQDGGKPVAPPLNVNGTYYGGTSTGTIFAFTP